MNEQQTALLEDARLYVSILFEKNVSPDFRFHNLSHVQNVADACSEIGSAYQLNDEDRLTLQLSAWFHDTGYRSGSALNHEDSSIEIARDFLLRKNADSQLINNVTACIQATKMPQSPQNLLGQILCDADLAHLGSEKATAYSKLLRQEINLTKGHHFGKKEWALINVAFMKNHQYFTDYAKEKFEPIKQEQIKIAEEKYGLAHIEPEKPAPHRHEEKEEHYQPEKKPKPIVPSRGIETMFRTTSANHFTLSSMADSKANIMISVNSIII
ncbi:MAG: HD domain-containing protein, partial [Gemmatimonadaceae bacterium]|nr:HD domain-containing protein [Chitinophagaceae bacterium]